MARPPIGALCRADGRGDTHLRGHGFRESEDHAESTQSMILQKKNQYPRATYVETRVAAALLCPVAMSFVRFVEIGRVCLITYGPDIGKLCTIVNVIDNNRVLVDGPEELTGCHRHAINLKRVQLTDIKVGIKLNCSKKCAARPRDTPPRAGAAG